MKEAQFEDLLKIVNGERPDRPPVGFIIDSPWLPGWAGVTTLDYYTSDDAWFKANLKALDTFPDVLFLPGFWAEYGMCTEPSAFGAKCVWRETDLPHADRIFNAEEEIEAIKKPDVRSDGLLPFVINRLKRHEPLINASGHRIKFAVSRGPLNIATFLMGTTEFLMAMKTAPEAVHHMLKVIADFIVDWIACQRECFPLIDGILLLDDIIGFIGEEDCREFVVPYIKKIYDSQDVSVRFLHNDADGRSSAPLLEKMGVNLFNFSFKHSMREMRQWAGETVALLGQIPPRDVLAKAAPEEIKRWVEENYGDLEDTRRILFSCGGGMPQQVSTEQIKAFAEAVETIANK